MSGRDIGCLGNNLSWEKTVWRLVIGECLIWIWPPATRDV